MADWELRDPWFLLVALLAPLVYYLAAGRNPATATYSTLSVLDGAARTWRVRLMPVPAILLALAVVAMALALGGPRIGDDQTRVRREGIAIVMVVDRSSSMNARDLVPEDTTRNRLDVVKELFRRFVEGDDDQSAGGGRPDDVLGLVAFAGYADGLCPLTLDHGNLMAVLDDLAIVTQRSEDGTAMGEGLALAVERLRKSPAKSKVAILLTDGVNNAGDITPAQAAELARAQDVKVYCIGAGTQGIAPYPARDPFTGRTVLRRTRVEIDEATLKAIAKTTAGRYFRATDAQSMAEIYRQIDELERTEITELRYLQYDERFGTCVAAALLLLAMAGLLNGTYFRRLP
jgi:Ca-activated chloride channel family protein